MIRNSGDNAFVQPPAQTDVANVNDLRLRTAQQTAGKIILFH